MQIRGSDPFLGKKLLQGVGMGILLLLGIIYVAYQARFVIAGPVVSLEHPTETIQSDQVVAVRGYTANITEITLNGRNIVTDQAGVFEESVVLQEGYNIIRIDVRDRFRRHNYIEKTLLYRPLSQDI